MIVTNVYTNRTHRICRRHFNGDHNLGDLQIQDSRGDRDCELCDQVHCQCGAITGEACAWHGPKNATVLVYHVPEHLRGSNLAAGNMTAFHAVGKETLRLERSCAEAMSDGDPWVEIA